MADFACRNPPSRIFVDINALIPYDTSNCSQHNKLHLRARIDGNGPIFIELWPGKVGCCNGMFWRKNPPGHNFVNIGPLTSVVSLKCSSWCRLSSRQWRCWFDYRVMWKNCITLEYCCDGSFMVFYNTQNSTFVSFHHQKSTYSHVRHTHTDTWTHGRTDGHGDRNCPYINGIYPHMNWYLNMNGS